MVSSLVTGLFITTFVLVAVSANIIKLDSVKSPPPSEDPPTQYSSRNEKDRSKRFIMYGTKWCGPGNKAKHDNDLGYFRNVDKCCRDHDRCPDKIHRDKQRWGVQNLIGFTISDCKCDHKFRACLKHVDKKGWNWVERMTAKSAGNLFFNFLQIPCLNIPDTVDRSESEVDLGAPSRNLVDFSDFSDYFVRPKAKLQNASTYKK